MQLKKEGKFWSRGVSGKIGISNLNFPEESCIVIGVI